MLRGEVFTLGERNSVKFATGDVRNGRVYVLKSDPMLSKVPVFNVYADLGGGVVFIGGDFDEAKANEMASTVAMGLRMMSFAVPVSKPEDVLESNTVTLAIDIDRDWE